MYWNQTSSSTHDLPIEMVSVQEDGLVNSAEPAV